MVRRKGRVKRQPLPRPLPETREERMLWRRLRNNQLNGLHFRRQHVIDGFIPDFYCHAAAWSWKWLAQFMTRRPAQTATKSSTGAEFACCASRMTIFRAEWNGFWSK